MAHVAQQVERLICNQQVARSIRVGASLCLLFATDVCAQPTCAVRCMVEAVHDADSPRVTLCLPLGINVQHVTLRAYGWDAYEVDRTRKTVAVDDVELVRGREARDAFVALLKTGTLYMEDARLLGLPVHPVYNRLDAIIWVRTADGEWIDVGDWAEEHMHLRSPRTYRSTSVVPGGREAAGF